MKSFRPFSMLIYLINRIPVGARELAGRFAMSVRTIQSGVNTLCAGSG